MNVAFLHSVAPIKRVFGKVLSSETVDRLATMNEAIRALREMGYRVVATDLGMERDRPTVQIVRDREQSIVPLLDVSATRWWRDTEEGKLGFSHFMGTIVTWRDA